jgi:hypothetical protein
MSRRSTTTPSLAIIGLGILVACTAIPATSTPAETEPTETADETLPAGTAPVEVSPGATRPDETAPAATLPIGSAVPTPSAAIFEPDEALEDMFPDDIGGQPLSVRSTTGEGILGLLPDLDPGRIGALLGQYGKTFEDASAAFAFAFISGEDPDDLGIISIAGLRVAAVPADQLVTGFTDIVTADAPGAEVTETTIAGKDVTVVSDPAEDPDSAVMLYGTDDVVFVMSGTPEHVEEALSELP